MKTPSQHIQHLITLSKPLLPEEDVAQAQLSLNKLALERRANLTGFREALLSLELAHRENIKNGHTPAIIDWIKGRISKLEANR